MVLESVGDDKEIMMEVVKMLENYGDFQEATYFAQLFSINKLLLSPILQQELLLSENAYVKILLIQFSLCVVINVNIVGLIGVEV